MSYLFGKDIARKFFPEENDAPVLLPTQTPTIYIFSSEPSRAVAAAGTGAIQTISTWTQQTSSPYPCFYTVSAIADPATTGTTCGAWYWEAINHITKTGGTSQVCIRAFKLELTRGNEATPGTTLADIKSIYPAIANYLTDEHLGGFLDMALQEMRYEMEARGITWALISDLHKTKMALAFKAISLAALSQMKQENDRFHLRYHEFKAKYENMMTLFNLPYDKDKDGKPEAEAVPQAGFLIVGR